MSNYSRFEYNNVQSSGLTPPAARQADQVLEGWVQLVIDDAAAANANGCRTEGSPCGVFVQEVRLQQCIDGYLCALQTVSALWPGAATGDEQTFALVLDEETGDRVGLLDYFGRNGVDVFLEKLTHVASKWQRENDAKDFGPFQPAPSELQWLPMADGFHVWVPKYEVGPGAYGVIELVVPDFVTSGGEEASNSVSDA